MGKISFSLDSSGVILSANEGSAAWNISLAALYSIALQDSIRATLCENRRSLLFIYICIGEITERNGNVRENINAYEAYEAYETRNEGGQEKGGGRRERGKPPRCYSRTRSCQDDWFEYVDRDCHAVWFCGRNRDIWIAAPCHTRAWCVWPVWRDADTLCRTSRTDTETRPASPSKGSPGPWSEASSGSCNSFESSSA